MARKSKTSSETASIVRLRHLTYRAELYDYIRSDFVNWEAQLRYKLPDDEQRRKFVERAWARREGLHAELQKLLSTLGDKEKTYLPLHAAMTASAPRVAQSAQTAQPVCYALEGVVASTRFYIDNRYTEAVGDASDVVNRWEYVNSPPTWESVRFKQFLTVGDACLKADIGTVFGFAALEYTFPNVPCDGYLYYDARTSFHLTTVRQSGWGKTNAFLHLFEQPDRTTDRPAHHEYTWSSAGFGSDGGYDYYNLPIAGIIPVSAGDKPRLVIGVEVNTTAGEDSVMGTNGWSYYMIWRPDNQDTFGVHYRIEPS